MKPLQVLQKLNTVKPELIVLLEQPRAYLTELARAYTVPYSQHEPEKFKFDLHVHTTASDGKSSGAEMQQRALDLGLDLIAIADHGCRTANAIPADSRFAVHTDARRRWVAVVHGSEGYVTIDGTDRDILLIGHRGKLYDGWDLDMLVREAHAQGGYVVAPHPLNPLGVVGAYDHRSSQAEQQRLVACDGLEVHNSFHAPPMLGANIVAKQLTVPADLPRFAFSDSHHVRMIGRSYSWIPRDIIADYGIDPNHFSAGQIPDILGIIFSHAKEIRRSEGYANFFCSLSLALRSARHYAGMKARCIEPFSTA